ncbi:1,4-dihydroxy-2-naphthoate polyprenyltransferase [Algivirga pacifica]|uniref:1,4-dihydroxy-2-naphthoate octaprenyltransferase n=2 Tax=Algivirga pacifica TaxID=1162670 RepID=A0ABP9DEQ1_9BACT
MGSFLAAGLGLFQWDVFLLCSLTTIFLQILSNLANDYGDSIHGADSAEREGPSRAVQSGAISMKAMKNAMILFGILSFVTGIVLLYISLTSMEEFLYFLGLGVLAIIAAITYTAGKKPYGYAGLGDISVMIFFGWVGVVGTFYLQAKQIPLSYFLPASSMGLLAVAVLNVNNIRDINSDIKAGKKSMPVRLGRRKARIYHWFLLLGAVLSAIIFVVLNYKGWPQWAFLLVLPLIFINGRAVQTKEKAAELDPYLKQMALTSLVFMLVFGLGHVLA